ncbi:hypothetical protein CPB83DRAFT_459613 [Crepidotus variabilis]|uniref:Nephrocystin 3-like N-terminal domain-containing protein n=1 Tax=Crepidotus variabilis TaxID=179855 RepID=A0A9P6EBU1_9AGAR|nr:hypothetical protein CPB83DRAFT_459613 [Crepidotus variabilis]
MEQITTAVASCILWLYGAAGAGKSSIAQSIAELCSEKGLLIGSFFFFRAAPLRNNPKRLSASLAYQLAQAMPFTLPHIAACITTNPAIFESSLQEQITKLFVQPLCKGYAEYPGLSNQPKLIILDGLDECDKPSVQQHILVALAKVFQGTTLPIVVLVASRPETHISATFESSDELSHIQTAHIGLNNDYDSDKDIRIFLNSKFTSMKRSHPFRQYIPDQWPNVKDIDYIVQKASGQFIFPATIVRYVEFGECKPHEQLRIVVDGSKRFASELGDSPFKEIDALYLHIFSGVRNIVLVLAIIFIRLDLHKLATTSATHPRTIETHLRLLPGDVHTQLSALASLLKFEGADQPIRLFHASLEDFLIDKRRSRGFYIKQPKVRAHLAKMYICRVLEPGSYSFNPPNKL